MASGTTLRFGLLVVAMSGAATTVGSAYTGWLVIGLDDIDPMAYRSCVFRLIADMDAGRPTPPSEDWREICGGPSPLGSTMVGLASLLLFWAAVLVLYWLQPSLRIRRRRLRPFPVDRLPGQARELAELRTAAGVREPVRYLVNLLDPAVTGLAFGRRGRRYVMLSRGLLQLHDEDPTAYRAIVLHELAHLRNRDVDIAFLTDSAWRVFLLGLLVPGVIGMPLTPLLTPSLSGPLSFYLLSACQLTLLGVLIPLARKSVLRSRELHADARAALTSDGAAGLTSVLSGAATDSAAEDGTTSTQTPDILRTHPTSGTRLRALADPGLLFTFTPRIAFALGVAATFSYEPVTDLVADISGTDRYGPLALLPLALVLGVGLALGIWRAELAACLTGRPWEHADSVGRWLGSGLVLGTIGSESYAASLGSAVEIPLSTMYFSWLVLMGGGYLAVRWTAGTARAWAPVVVSGKHPRAVILGTVGALVVLLSVWLSYLLQLGSWSEALGASDRFRQYSAVTRFFIGAVLQPVVLVPPLVMIGLLVGTALIPMLGGVVARRTAVRPPHRFVIGEAPGDWRPPPPEPGPGVALRTALWISGVGAVFCWSAHLLSALFAPEILLPTSFTQGLTLAGLVQVVVALVVERRTRAAARELRLLHAVLAAAVTGAVLHLTLIVSRDHFGCVHWGFAASEYCRFVPEASEWRIVLLTQSWGLFAATVVVLLRIALARDPRKRGRRMFGRRRGA
ncbi:M56 family metallopeptidase [Streptomyces sp. AK02-01A]|uniref:M48 family metallopeptidase n=1 Tax=Streptomyces sp. AK02-01A TaxID=3028648 RepID=UPI0029A1EA39|nr:M56 family metallopeptidase [Streptomyces sp. AK02-01A]MDX3853472.1 M56 family metallopeptidase [Streptomyces sp. AK02-01A]